MVSSKKVCMVGAGLLGLASARELLREGHDVTVMEQSGGVVGGQWLYDPGTDGGDPFGPRRGRRAQQHVRLRSEEAFDAVVVAIGQYTQPRLPTISPSPVGTI
ncbi:unnamed protein product [Urochloa humidicola]